jgi:hypothetical protein
VAKPLLLLRLGATGVFLLVALGGVLLGVFFPSLRVFFWGISLAGLLEIPSYWALSLTLRLSNGKFFAAFMGGMLGRMAVLGTSVGILWRFHPGAVMSFVFAAVVGIIGFSVVELFFIGRQNRLKI